MNHDTLTDLLEQDRVWVNRDGDTLMLADIDADYLSNIIAFIERRAPDYVLYCMEEATAPWAGAQYDDELRGYFDEVRKWIGINPVSWVRAKPLHRALTRHLERRKT